MVEPSHHTTHGIRISSPAGTVYGLLADVENWPQVFPPTVWVDHLDRSTDHERIRIWATANGEVKNWTSLRHLDQDAGRIEFRQEVSAPPVAAMSGTWSVRETSPGETEVTLTHDYAAVDDVPENVVWIEEAIDRNSHAELEALKYSAEAGADSLFSFADDVTVAGRASDVFEFINRAEKWSDRLPHVTRVGLTEHTNGVQTLEMDTRAPDGTIHTTRSIRVCFPHRLIAYKQLVVPTLLRLHTGRWIVQDNGDGTVALTSWHAFAIKQDAVTAVLGEAATVTDATEFVRKALSANSTTTMHRARDFAESATATTP